MNYRHHPEAASLMSYAAGALPEPFAVLVAAHAETCPECRAHLKALNALGGALVCEDAGVDDDEIERLMGRLDEDKAPPSRLPPLAPTTWPEALARLLGGGAEALPWRSAGPGLEMHRRAFAGDQGLRFLRAAPGVAIPEHGHPAAEMTLVLEGELEDGDRRYAPGEICDLGDDVWHQPRAAGERPCICVIAEEGLPIFVRE